MGFRRLNKDILLSLLLFVICDYGRKKPMEECYSVSTYGDTTLIVGIGLPVLLKDHSVTLGSVIKAYYLLPTNSTDYTQPSIDLERGKRSLTRFSIYSLIEYFLSRYGYGDGKACLLREICEIAARPLDVRSGILSEIVQLLLTPSSTQEALDNYSASEYLAAEKLGRDSTNCTLLFPECRRSFLQQFSRNFQT